MKCIEDEIPFDVPEGWEFSRLQTIISLNSGKSIKVRQLEEEGKYPVYGGNGINGYYDDYNVYSNTIIIGRVGFYCGSIHLTSEKSWITDNALIVSVKTPVFIQDFFAEILRFLDLGKTSVSTAQPVVSGKGILPLIIPVPPIAEQERIILKFQEMISEVDKIEHDKDSLSDITNITKAKILDLAIRGKLVPQNPNDEPASILLERIRKEKIELIKQGKMKRDKKESIIYKGDDNSYYEKFSGKPEKCIDGDLPFKIPDNWRWEKIRNLFILNPKNNIDDNMIVSFIPMAMIDDGYTGDFTYEKKPWGACKKGFTHFADGDICFAKISPCFENRKSALFVGLNNGYGSGTTELYVLRRFTEDLLPEYILSFIKSEFFINRGKNTFSGVVGQQRVDKDIILDTFIPVPSKQEQKKVYEKIQQAFNEIEMIEDCIS